MFPTTSQSRNHITCGQTTTPMLEKWGEDSIVAETRAWIDSFVIGLELCPWAKFSQNTGGLRISATDVRTFDEALQVIRSEASLLEKATSVRSYSTTLVVIPRVQGFHDFTAYLDFVGTVESELEADGWGGKIQVATFHPKYQFSGTASEGDEVNYTNKSPYPTLHLLWESQVTAAVESFDGDTDQIWQANEDTMRKMGRDRLLALQEQCSHHTEKAKTECCQDNLTH